MELLLVWVFFFGTMELLKLKLVWSLCLNNLKIPLGVIFAIILVNESVNIIQLTIGSALILLALRIGKYSKNDKELN